jgi:hypothetical protein
MRRKISITLASTIVLMLLLEGLASFVSLGLSFWESRRRVPAEQRHSSYDSEIGWVPTPNTRIPGFYGSGRDLTINALGARSANEYGREIPPGKMRMVFFGDSFTQGWGVGDKSVWNQVFSENNPRIEAINFGMGGYGVDQAYLWFLRATPAINYDIHVFAFNTGDFQRATEREFSGYPKPLLKMSGEQIVVTNTPVPRTAKLRQWWSVNSYRLRELRIIDLLLKLRDGVPDVVPHASAAGSPVKDALSEDSALKELVRGIFHNLKSNAEKNRAALMLAYLPTYRDYDGFSFPEWRRFIHEEAARQGAAVFDPLQALQMQSAEEVKSMFISPEEAPMYGGAWHYNEKGNRFIADQFSRWLVQQPEVKARLGLNQ